MKKVFTEADNTGKKLRKYLKSMDATYSLTANEKHESNSVGRASFIHNNNNNKRGECGLVSVCVC